MYFKCIISCISCIHFAYNSRDSGEWVICARMKSSTVEEPLPESGPVNAGPELTVPYREGPG